MWVLPSVFITMSQRMAASSSDLSTLNAELRSNSNVLPEQLQSTAQRYSALLDGIQSRHSTNMQRARDVDSKLNSLAQALLRHQDLAQCLVHELNNLSQTKQQVHDLQLQIQDLRPTLQHMDQLYSQLARCDTQWTEEITKQAAEYRNNRRKHYQQLQKDMDGQYAQLRSECAGQRVSNAERSFQRDLENYRQRANTSLPTASTPRKDTKKRGGDIATVVLTPNIWDADSQASVDGFFSSSNNSDVDNTDEEDKLVKTATKDEEDAGRNDGGDKFAILKDDDFEC